MGRPSSVAEESASSFACEWACPTPASVSAASKPIAGWRRTLRRCDVAKRSTPQHDPIVRSHGAVAIGHHERLFGTDWNTLGPFADAHTSRAIVARSWHVRQTSIYTTGFKFAA